MTQEKLKEMRGEEPAFIPGHVDESWRRVEFGLGASTMQSSPEAWASQPRRRFPWMRVILVSILCAGLITILIRLISR